MSVKVKIVPKRTATLMIGVIIGRRIRNSVRQKPAPSTAAASGISFGTAVLRASRITVEKGIRRQLWTRRTEVMARWGSPSHMGAMNGLYTCSAPSTQLIIFFQAEDGIRDLTVTGVQTCALPI